MSAFICNPSHLGILAAATVHCRCPISEYANNEPILIAQGVARELARENIRSVAARYPRDVSGSRPGPCLGDAEIEEAAALYAAHYVVHIGHVTKLKAVELLSLISCLEYQSCETDDYGKSLACRQLEWLRGAIIRTLPGYDKAPYEYRGNVESIEALIWGEPA